MNEGIRLSHLPGTPLPSRPRRPFGVRARQWLLRPVVVCAVLTATAVGIVIAFQVVGR